MKERRGGFGQNLEKITRLPFLFPYEVEGKENLEQLKILLQNNKAILLITNHFSKRDAVQGVQIFVRYLAPYSRKAVMPFAIHQFKPAMGKVLEKLNIEPHPIVDLILVEL